MISPQGKKAAEKRCSHDNRLILPFTPHTQGKQAAEEEVQGLSQQVKEMQLLLSKFEEESNSEAR